MGFMHFPGQPTGPTQPQLFNHTVPHPDPTPTNTGTKDRHATNANVSAFKVDQALFGQIIEPYSIGH